jgi:ribosomal protein S10
MKDIEKMKNEKKNYSFYLKFKTFDTDLFYQLSTALPPKLTSGEDIKLILSKGPIPLPCKKKLFTVNRSHHIHKKAQEQFIQTTYSRLYVFELESKLELDQVLNILKKVFIPFENVPGLSLQWKGFVKYGI